MTDRHGSTHMGPLGRWLPLLAAAFLVTGCDVFSPSNPSGNAPTATMTPSISAAVSPGTRLLVGFRATDSEGMAVAGAEVSFQVVAGGGEVDTGPKVTEADGRTSTIWQVGVGPGPQTVRAEAVLQPEAAEGEPIEFSATTSLEVVGEEDPFVQVDVASGGNHTCALTSGGAVYCWGFSDRGQLGPGLAVPQRRPVRVPDLPTTAQVVAGGWRTCILSTAGETYCWGDGYDDPPTLVDSEIGFSSLALGVRHGCGLTPEGAAYCWGAGGRGQLGTGDVVDAPTPVPVAGDLVFEALAANRHTCGLTTEGKAYCWGDNDQHRLGTGTPGVHTTPTPVQGDLRFGSIHVGTRVSCGITVDGEAYCWGSGAELGTRSEGPHVDPEPAPVAGGLVFQSLAIGYHHACGVTVEGRGYCWGSGMTGGLGDGRPEPLHAEREPIPIEVPGSTRFSSVGSAVNHSCAWAVDPEPTLYCWGGHGNSALVGRGPSPDRLPGPVLLPGPPG